ncbi:MAG: hypothetical protein WCC36_08235 [Gammaproteobacteria bacterium]
MAHGRLWRTAMGTACTLGLAAAALPVHGGTVHHAQRLIGAYPAPPKGPGPGRLEDWQIGASQATVGRFGTPHTLSGNSFYVAYSAREHAIYVPTVAGQVMVLDAGSLAPRGHFTTVSGARVARAVPEQGLLLVLSRQALVGYSTRTRRQRFSVDVGGNALAVSPDGRHAFIGGNADRRITEIALPSGHIQRTFPVGHSGDLVWARGKVFSADMKTGLMSVLDPRTGHVQAIKTPEVDPHFSYRHIPRAQAGFMQLAVGARGRKVYAAGFSGHILAFSAVRDRYLGEVPVDANPGGPVKLSGLAIVDHGREAVATVENLKETVVVRLADGRIVRTLHGAASNRWVPVP